MPVSLALTLFLDSIAAPALAGAGGGLLAHTFMRGRELATSLAVIAGMLCIYGNQFAWPPLQAMDWLILLLPLFALPGMLFTSSSLYGTTTLALSLTTAYVILSPALQFSSSALLIIAAAGTAWAAYLAGQRRGDAERGETGALAGTALALAVIVATGGSALLGQVMAALGATSVGLLLWGITRHNTMPLLPVRAALFGLGLIAFAYAEIPATLLVIPLRQAMVSARIARRYASSMIAVEGLAFIAALLLAAPLWGTMLARRLSGPVVY